MLTTKEAAERLGVSVRRVNALIAAGGLQAERFGRSWMVDERSVEERVALDRGPGRLKMDERDPGNLVRYTLMNRNHPVLDFTYNRRTRQTADLVVREGSDWKPLGIGLRERDPNRYDLAAWISARSIPDLRPNLSPVLRKTEAANAADLMFASWGLNLSDQYWFKPEGADLDWHAINYFENSYEERYGEMLLDGSRTAAPGVDAGPRCSSSPDSATPGMLPKTWTRENGVDYLVKGGTGGENREPYHEVLASRLLARLCDEGEYVPYELVKRHGRAYSRCATMVTAETELVAAADVLVGFGVSEGRDPYHGYRKACYELGVPCAETLIGKMLVADYLMANFDRHTHNFGLIRNVEALDGYRVAPLFDHGCGFYSRATVEELLVGRYLWESHPFRRYPSQQLALVEDMGWYDPQRLDGFLDEVVEVLAANPGADGRFVEAVRGQTAKQIETVNDLAAERCAVFGGFGQVP